MTKKLFVVLVVIAAMLISFSLVIAAKKAPQVKPERFEYEKPVKGDRPEAMSMTTLGKVAQPEDPSQRFMVGVPQKPEGIGATSPVDGTPTELFGGTPKRGGLGFCDMTPPEPYTNVAEWIWGDELYANYQDPEAFGCEPAPIYPFEVTEIDFQLYFPTENTDLTVVGLVVRNVGTPECPEPGDVICETPEYAFASVGPGYYTFVLPMVEECCVYEAYFAGVYISSVTADVEMVTYNDPTPCASYNDWGGGWADLYDYEFPGPLVLYSMGYVSDQNECPEGECFVKSVEPFYLRVLPGEAAQFDVTVQFVGFQTECALTANLDPECTNCTATLVPETVVLPDSTSTLTIQTDASTPAGYYYVDVNGAKVEVYVEVVEPGTDCELYRHWPGGAVWYTSRWSVGDMDAIWLDPAELCIGCEGDVYPYYLQKIRTIFYDFAGAGSWDVIFHLFETQGGDPCNGPGAEIYSFPVEGIETNFAWAEFTLPDKVCITEPFWLAVEYNSGEAGSIPCLIFDGTLTGTPCYEALYKDGEWILWEDWYGDLTGTGYLFLRAVGSCNDPYCAPGEVCDMQQDMGLLGRFWYQEAGDEIFKYYDPEVYCEPPVYPYKIDDLDVYFYDFAEVGAVDIAVHVYLQCEDSCDGPGPEIYASDPITITTFHPNWAHIVLDQVVCVYEPFFISVEYLTGEYGSTPGLVCDRFPGGDPQPYRPDTCHAYFYFIYYDYMFEHYEAWTLPDSTGYPFMRVSGYTAHGDCDPPPCDTVIEKLAGGQPPPPYYWKFPQATFDLPNQRFEMPLDHGGRLESFQVALYERYDPGMWGDPNPDFYVWLSDGELPLDNNPPHQAIFDFHITHGEIAWYPDYNIVDAHSWEITFDEGEMFHIGVGHANEEGDTISVLSDLEGTHAGEIRGGNWNRTDEWEPLTDDYWFLMDAFICPFAPSGSTFTLKCSPKLEVVTPEDPAANLFSIEVKPVAGYPYDVSLVLLSIDPTPDQPITVVITPSSGTPEYTADVNITCPAGVAYDDYILTFEGTGDPPDNQVKICNVTLRVQPPYDEVTVDFFHGFQRMTNYGAVANDAEDNFTYYGMSTLYDGTFISAVPAETPEDQRNHFALDIFDCEHLGFKPENYIPAFPPYPWCPLTEYQEFYGFMAYTDFYTDEDVISCEYDSLFVIGLKNVVCTDFAIKVKIYYNPTGTPIPELWIGMCEDWDVGENDCWADMDTLRNLMWMYEVVNPDTVFGTMKVPFYCDTVSQPPADDYWETYSHPLHSMVAMRNDTLVYPNAGFCDDAAGYYGLDTLWSLMTNHQYTGPEFWFTGDDSASDLCFLYSAPPFSLNPGEKHIEVWIDFGLGGVTDPDFRWSVWYHNVLRYAGFYRGDVDASDTLELPALDISDLVYLNNYLFKGGPPPQPFADQGNVDGMGPYGAFVGDNIDFVCPKNNVDVSDRVYLVNYIFKKGPPPVDYVRFIPSFYSRPSLFTDPVWK